VINGRGDLVGMLYANDILGALARREPSSSQR